jgi:hypothetical protein
MQILQPIQKQIKFMERQLELTKQIQSQIKQFATDTFFEDICEKEQDI